MKRCPHPDCHSPAHSLRRMRIDGAAEVYRKLRPFLRVIPSFGCYAPSRGGKPASHALWPLHSWDGPGTFPLVVAWDPKGKGRHPTFIEWCRVYNIEPVAP